MDIKSLRLSLAPYIDSLSKRNLPQNHLNELMDVDGLYLKNLEEVNGYKRGVNQIREDLFKNRSGSGGCGPGYEEGRKKLKAMSATVKKMELSLAELKRKRDKLLDSQSVNLIDSSFYGSFSDHVIRGDAEGNGISRSSLSCTEGYVVNCLNFHDCADSYCRSYLAEALSGICVGCDERSSGGDVEGVFMRCVKEGTAFGNGRWIKDNELPRTFLHYPRSGDSELNDLYIKRLVSGHSQSSKQNADSFACFVKDVVDVVKIYAQTFTYADDSSGRCDIAVEKVPFSKLRATVSSQVTVSMTRGSGGDKVVVSEIFNNTDYVCREHGVRLGPVGMLKTFKAYCNCMTGYVSFSKVRGLAAPAGPSAQSAASKRTLPKSILLHSLRRHLKDHSYLSLSGSGPTELDVQVLSEIAGSVTRKEYERAAEVKRWGESVAKAKLPSEDTNSEE